MDDSACTLLTTTKKNNDFKGELTEGILDLLILQKILENKSGLNFDNWLAHRNADTFAVAVLGLAALGWNCAEVENSILSIDGDQFLTALSEYSYGRQPTPELRTPNSNSQTPFSAMNTSDESENHSLFRKFKRALRLKKRGPPEATSKSPLNSSCSPSDTSTAAGSLPEVKTATDSLTVTMSAVKIGENRFPGSSSTSSTSPPDQISNDLSKTKSPVPPRTF